MDDARFYTYTVTLDRSFGRFGCIDKACHAAVKRVRERIRMRIDVDVRERTPKGTPFGYEVVFRPIDAQLAA